MKWSLTSALTVESSCNCALLSPTLKRHTYSAPQGSHSTEWEKKSEKLEKTKKKQRVKIVVSIEKGFSKELEYKVIAGVRQKDKWRQKSDKEHGNHGALSPNFILHMNMICVNNTVSVQHTVCGL